MRKGGKGEKEGEVRKEERNWFLGSSHGSTESIVFSGFERLLRALANLRSAIISFVISVVLSVRME